MERYGFVIIDPHDMWGAVGLARTLNDAIEMVEGTRYDWVAIEHYARLSYDPDAMPPCGDRGTEWL